MRCHRRDRAASAFPLDDAPELGPEKPSLTFVCPDGCFCRLDELQLLLQLRFSAVLRTKSCAKSMTISKTIAAIQIRYFKGQKEALLAARLFLPRLKLAPQAQARDPNFHSAAPVCSRFSRRMQALARLVLPDTGLGLQ